MASFDVRGTHSRHTFHSQRAAHFHRGHKLARSKHCPRPHRPPCLRACVGVGNNYSLAKIQSRHNNLLGSLKINTSVDKCHAIQNWPPSDIE